MRSYRLGLIVLLAVCPWSCTPLCAQASLPPEEEPSLPTTWQEESIAAQLQPPPNDAFVGSPEPPGPAYRGGGGMGGGPLGGPGSGSPFSAYAFLTPDSDLQNQSGALSVRGLGVSLSLPASIRENGIWLVNVRVEHEAIETDAALPGSTEPFPEELWNINLGLMHIHSLDNGWTAGGMVGMGSASDRPFASSRELNANLLAFLSIPTRERDAWNFSLFYSPLGQLAFPVPGIAYAWRPSERFQMNIGLPFSLTCRPTDLLSFDLSYLPLTNASAMVRWTPSNLWAVYGGYQTHSQGYDLAGRTDPQERFFDFDQRLKLGVRRTLGAGFTLDGSVACLFDRSYFRSDSFFGDGAESLLVDPGTQFLLRLEWTR